MDNLYFHNEILRSCCLPARHRKADIDLISRTLNAHGTLLLTPLQSGLYSASNGIQTGDSGYDKVWVRDNVYVALAQLESGNPNNALAVAKGLIRFFSIHRERFDNIIAGRTDPTNVQNRPHVRFNGKTLTEIQDQHWAHAQNDAIGYFLWLCAILSRRKVMSLDSTDYEILSLVVQYLRAIRFWEDEDSGHWEEARKISSSSIGVVVAGLDALAALLDSLPPHSHIRQNQLLNLTSDLIGFGRRELAATLPNECKQISPLQNRRYDAALIFLLYPLGVVEGAMADLILSDVRRFLTGHIGIRRYLRDSYWAPEYDTRVPQSEQTRDYSEDMYTRDVLLERVGDEAQWCIFDSILSVIYGQRFQQGGAIVDREFQALHFNRAIAQITQDWKCPELYYLKDGLYRPNPHSPLLWAQANLTLAFKMAYITAS
ncbi:phosphorylase kinase [Methylococcaceae bacterium WWC4]|nr:phosphorylase kinase [Methylococcaceae bacterium WWC4]